MPKIKFTLNEEQLQDLSILPGLHQVESLSELPRKKKKALKKKIAVYLKLAAISLSQKIILVHKVAQTWRESGELKGLGPSDRNLDLYMSVRKQTL